MLYTRHVKPISDWARAKPIPRCIRQAILCFIVAKLCSTRTRVLVISGFASIRSAFATRVSFDCRECAAVRGSRPWACKTLNVTVPNHSHDHYTPYDRVETFQELQKLGSVINSVYRLDSVYFLWVASRHPD